MATRILLNLSDATSQCILTNVVFHRIKSPLPDVLKHRRSFRRIRTREETDKIPFIGNDVQYIGSPRGKLWKSFVFASAFTGASFVGATIWEYEKIRSKTIRGLARLPSFHRPFRTSAVGWREQANNWWNGLTEGQRTFYFILYSNVIVYLAWRVPQLQKVMYKYFTNSPSSSATYLPMILSVFSHYNLWHLAANMYVLHSFSTIAVSHMGREQFVAFYLSSGVISSFLSNAYKIFLSGHGVSLGASGAIMGVLAFTCSQYPDMRVSIFPINLIFTQFTFTAGLALKSILALDAAGCILRWQLFDHAAHLGGAIFGIFWQTWGLENLWRKRSPILTYWHEFRSPPRTN
ncbi:hypothetical protein QAD02_017684 [Eretmocerus hayati]|uniref:Uncharacterized protein n=1 Tax=Eretmocerus hayati TaxID=131215 RepID=A0ACC2PEX2_9HYME|nr:hypothetical protein QAD02_017684 [Eretmocerus hayati]